MSDLVRRIMELHEPGSRIPQDIPELERLIVIEPDNTSVDVVGAVSHWKQHGSLESYDRKKFAVTAANKAKAVSALSDAFKRILLFEVSAYISGTYALSFPNEPSTPENVISILRAQTSLLNNGDYKKAHDAVVAAYGNIKQRADFPVTGRAESSYLYHVGEILRLCEPDKVLKAINTGFAGRHIAFDIQEWGEYLNKDQICDGFAQFSEKHSPLFHPVMGYMLFRSPELVEHAEPHLDAFARRHHIIDANTVSLSGRNPLEHFRALYKR